jgi:acetate---CoA ligase (ADP-forming)
MLNSSLTDPKSIAIIGASRSPEKPGGRLVINLAGSGYTGNIYPVNPKEDEINGLKVYHSIQDLPHTELAILAIPAHLCVETVEVMALTKSTKAFIIISAGFSEMGNEGKQLEQRLKVLAEQFQLSVIGPNCIGVLNPSYKAIFVSPLPPVVGGGADFVSASGALAVFLFEMAAKYGLRFGSVYTVGNSVTIGVEEVLRYWDINFSPKHSGRVKMVYAEQIKKPEMFFRHIQSLRAKGCHVVVLKPGETEAGARAALSHTGSMAGDSEAYGYLIRKAGAIRCYCREELVYLANILLQKQLRGKNLAIITHAGGPGVMLADQLYKAGLHVPEIDKVTREKLLDKLHSGSSAVNPIDMLATAKREQLSYVVNTCNSLEYIDGMVVIYGKTGMEDLFGTYKVLHEATTGYEKPVYHVLPSINSAVEEIQAFVDFGHSVYTDEVVFGRCLAEVVNAPEAYARDLLIPRNVSPGRETVVLSDQEVLNRLKNAGILTAPAFFISRESEIEKNGHMSYPVAAKVQGILHKTEVGGVILDINSEEELKEAFNRLMSIKDAQGIQVQQMVKGIELYLGAKRHDGIGFSVHAGLGGIFVELVRDIVSTLAPVSYQEALAILSGLKAQKLFSGYRNMAPVSKEAFARLIVSFSMLFKDYPDIVEMDINPLIASGDGIYSVDARIITDKEIN